MITRRILLIGFGAMLGDRFGVEAQHAKVSRVGVLSLGSSSVSPQFEALRKGLRERGWLDGQNIVFEDRTRVDQYTRLPEVAATLVALNVDVLVTFGSTATEAAAKATNAIPVVMVAAIDPVQRKLAASLARPGGNITGLTTFMFDLNAKRLELLKEVIPSLSRVGVLLNRDSASEVASLQSVEAAARSLGVKLRLIEVRRIEDLEGAFSAIAHDQVDALAPIPSTMLTAHRTKVTELAAKHRLPAIFQARQWVEAGGLMSYGINPVELAQKAAEYVDRILRGARAGDLPIQQPTKVELVVNLKTAKALGLTIPPSILLRADHVIQ